MIKELLSVPRYLMGHVCVLVAILMAQLAHWLSFLGAVCLDHEEWWKQQDKEIAAKFRE